MEEAKELLSKVITKLAEDATKTIANKAKAYFVDREYKEQIDLGYAYEEYLNKVYETYSKSKSVIYTNESRELKRFFVPMDLRYEKDMPIRGGVSFRNPGSYTLSANNIRNVFSKNNRIIITGIGGLGKTMHMKHFCISAIESGYKIPVFIPLRWFNDRDIGDKPFERLIHDILKEFGFKLEEKYFQYSLESDKYVFLFDGYDEVNRAKINQISTYIQSFSHRYSGNSFIISTRQIDSIYGWDEYVVYSLCPLKLKDAVRLIWNLDFAEDMKKRFIDELRGGLYKKYESLASVPLLLSIMYMTYVDNALIPESLGEFYERAFETLLYAHDRRQKVGFEREFSSELSYIDFKDVFRAFCFRSYFNDEYSFSEDSLIDNIRKVKGVAESAFDARAYKDDLVNITCMLIKDGLEYAFIHRSFQEYFAANFVSKKMLEEQQREFCFQFINQTNIKVTAGFASDLCPESNKTTEFLIMLYNIDQKRFEHVVLKPIINKIARTYKNCKMDLYSTVRNYVQGEYLLYEDGPDSITYRIYYMNTTVNGEHPTANEFIVLWYFYRHIFSGLFKTHKEKVKEQLNLDEFDLHKVPNDWLLITIVNDYDESITYGNYNSLRGGTSEVKAEILALFDLVIERHELLNRSEKRVAFIEQINNPSFYTN